MWLGEGEDPGLARGQQGSLTGLRAAMKSESAQAAGAGGAAEVDTHVRHAVGSAASSSGIQGYNRRVCRVAAMPAHDPEAALAEVRPLRCSNAMQ